ncbi:hypothetical protein [Aureimonas populi]|uniref:Uncharacterized protein n=1 Tax=Aureimonas populi TaxID=1701758 RepID=A0ABW5CJT7_9HYPH|nr:hypothetical protein [Aureimonas populi]
MSISEDRPNRFNDWLRAEFSAQGDFTVLLILVEIGEPSVTPVRSTFLNVIGDEVRWKDMVELFDRSGAAWNGAAFFPLEGLVPSQAARLHLRELEERVREDRRVLNEGHFFDASGRRMTIEEVMRH